MAVIRPSRVSRISDDFAAHVARNSGLAGTDYVTPKGTPVWAVADGTVVEAHTGIEGLNGRYVKVKHNSGQLSYYLHLSKVTVKKGQKVRQRQQLGLSGGSGRGSETGYGYHLHFSWSVKGVLRDFEKVIARQLKAAAKTK